MEANKSKYSNNLLCNMQYYMEYCQANGYITPQEWLDNHKHYSDSKEPVVYTEHEVITLCNEAWLQALKKQNFPKTELGFGSWFDKNKKR